jgi:hypothetical protein
MRWAVVAIALGLVAGCDAGSSEGMDLSHPVAPPDLSAPRDLFLWPPDNPDTGLPGACATANGSGPICDPATQYCFQAVGGAAHPPPHGRVPAPNLGEGCLALPTTCLPQPTCACLLALMPGVTCTCRPVDNLLLLYCVYP